MRLLSRYLIRTMVAPFLFSLVALTGMLLLNHISRALPELVGKGLGAAVIIESLILSLPFIVALTMPMAALVAVLYGFGHLAADSEITAMKASGVSLAQMLRPALVWGLLLTLTTFFFVDQILPRSNARLKALRMDIARVKPTVALKVDAINELAPSTYHLRASRIDAETGAMREIVLFDMGLAEGRRIIYADSGRLAFLPNGSDMTMQLYDGEAHDYRNDDRGALQVTEFASTTILVRAVQNELGRTTSDFDEGEREKSTCEMMAEVVRAERRKAEHLDRRHRLVDRDLRVLLGLEQPALPRWRRDTTTVQQCGPWAAVDGIMKGLLLPTRAEAQDPAEALEERTSRELPELSVAGEAMFAQSQYEEAETTTFRYRVEIHKKLSISLACLNFMLIGVALALRFPSGGFGLVMGGSIIIFTIFYVGLTAGESIAKKGWMSPALSMWAPNILIFAAGLLGLLLVRQFGGSTRGGSQMGLLDTVRGWARRGARR
jgi:lipopolysaccharide export system permease protein